jgi:hypothetical protein
MGEWARSCAGEGCWRLTLSGGGLVRAGVAGTLAGGMLAAPCAPALLPLKPQPSVAHDGLTALLQPPTAHGGAWGRLRRRQGERWKATWPAKPCQVVPQATLQRSPGCQPVAPLVQRARLPGVPPPPLKVDVGCPGVGVPPRPAFERALPHAPRRCQVAAHPRLALGPVGGEPVRAGVKGGTVGGWVGVLSCWGGEGRGAVGTVGGGGAGCASPPNSMRRQRATTASAPIHPTTYSPQPT